MKLYEIMIRSHYDDIYVKTILVMCSTPITKETEGINIMANITDEGVEDWGEYIDSVCEKRVLVCARGDEEASDMFGVLSLFGQ